MAETNRDIESGKGQAGKGPSSVPQWKLILDQGLVLDEVLNWNYEGKGTEEDPFVVEWIENDPRNPMLFSKPKKWVIALTMAFATLAVSFCSSAFSGGTFHLS